MSYTPCPYCAEPLLGYAGSACSSAACDNRARSDDLNPYGKSIDGSSYLDSRPRSPGEQGKARAMARAFKGIR